jgi:2-phosphosulfolactate phosphatase
VIDVAFTRRELRPAAVAVVIDVLRATSTAISALGGGYERVLMADGLQAALAARAPGRVIAGERHCLTPPGFDHGNSPAEAAVPRGRELVLATTNGTPAVIAATQMAPVVLLGSLLNLDALVLRLSEEEDDIQLVCSGTDGAPALEDAYVAGRVAARLDQQPTDAARIAIAVAGAYLRPVDALLQSADGAILREAGLAQDITDCARESVLDIVPIARADGHGFAAALEVRSDRLPVIG